MVEDGAATQSFRNRPLPIRKFCLSSKVSVVKWWEYEFLPIDPIKDEMKQVYNILRPGGYFIFTFSDCEYEAQLDLMAGPEGYYSYNTKTLMISLVEMLGFEIVKTDVWREAQSYMVVKKPGDLQTQKKSASIVQITPNKLKN